MNTLRQRIEPLQYRLSILPAARRHQDACLRRVREKARASVVFIVSSLSMWRFQELYEMLRQDTRFSLHFALYPFPSFGLEQRKTSIEEICAYCEEHDIAYLNLSQEEFPGAVLREQLQPDILFYQQSYNQLYNNDLDAPFQVKSLNCYIPYSIRTSTGAWVYRNYLSETAWRLFYCAELHREEAGRILYNKGRNICVVGDCMLDNLAAASGRDVWKPQEKPKKRVIWAPHFSILDGDFLHRDSFTWVSECMLEMAQKYQEQIQFAFKPHPRLLSELQKHPSWGEIKAKAYYDRWKNGANTQLECGPYSDLFKGSDAMIHDSGSFSVEYHFTGKPVMFTSRDMAESVQGQNELGREGILAHYQGANKDDICSFLENVVLAGTDPMKPVRLAFCEKYFPSYKEGKAAGRIYHEILKGLNFKEA